MAEYFFVLGKASALCQAELQAVLKRQKIDFQEVFASPEIFHFSTSSPLDIDYLIKTLGGTVKIAQTAGEFSVEKFISYLKSGNESKKTIFGISGYGVDFNQINEWNKQIKDELEKSGLKARFILPKRGETSLSSVVVKKQNVLEVMVIKEKEALIYGQTMGIQDFEDWGKRDFQRPAPNPHQGMLPPKVARMMVNLGSSNFLAPSFNYTLLDPFCGVGTILAEGMMLGGDIEGSDQSEEAVEKTGKNLEWLRKNYQVSGSKIHLFKADATHISEALPPDSIDALVTEPYLGPMEMTGAKIKKIDNIVLGLEKLYLGCLRDWRKVLKTGAKIVIALPSFKINQREVFVKKTLDTCENLGYTLLAGPYQYGRPQAVVTRNIYILEKNGTH